MDARSKAAPNARLRIRLLAAAALIVAATAAPAAAQTTCATPALGCWKQLPNPAVTSVNAVALKTGKTLVVNQGLVGGQQLYQLFDPVTDTFSTSAVVPVDHRLYCSGFDQVGESGDVLFAGGLTGVHLKHATIYHPATDTWSAQPDMVASRFYPTVVTVSRRDLLALDGNGVSANIPERFRIRFGDWQSLFHAEYGLNQPPPNDFELPNYPRFHVLSTGELIYTGSREFSVDVNVTRLFDPLFETWREPFATPDAIAGTSGVMYESDTILKAGPTQTWTLQATTPNAVWEQRSSLNQSRPSPFFVALPDGKVLAVGSVTTPEIWDPAADTWTNMAPASQARGDHSSAVLLPDGRVLHAGPTLTAEVYSPPYLWTAGGFLARRPAITSVTGPSPGVIQYGEEFGLTSPRGAVIDSIRLNRLGAATHSWDMGQQSMLLSFRPACCDPTEEPGVNGNPICFEGHTCCANGEWECNNANGTPACPTIIISPEPTEQESSPSPLPEPIEPIPAPIPNICQKLLVEAPQHPYQSPPGYHYIFIVENGVPSKAKIVQAVVE
jgi:hypothetical protein